MRIYHTTTADAAEAILREGFRDASGWYGFVRDDGTRLIQTGVFFSDVPVGVNEGAKGDPLLGDPVLVVEIPEDEIAEYGWTDAIREWCIPAEIVNRYGKPALLPEDELYLLTLTEVVVRVRNINLGTVCAGQGR
jgi:hypothetical protein